jgi:hypothetical protein
MRLELSTTLGCPPDRVWQQLRGPRLFRYLCAPLVTFRPLQPTALPEQWGAGDEYLVRMYLFGLVPLGKQWMRPSLVEPETAPGRQRYQIHDNGSGGLCKKWDHWLTAEEAAGGKTRYTDRIDIEAGLLTPVVWLFARVLFRWRHRRWRRLVRHGFDYTR